MGLALAFQDPLNPPGHAVEAVREFVKRVQCTAARPGTGFAAGRPVHRVVHDFREAGIKADPRRLPPRPGDIRTLRDLAQFGIKLAAKPGNDGLLSQGLIAMAGSVLKVFVCLLACLTANMAVAASYKNIPMNQKRLATYYIQANMQGSGAVEFMVDTGAGYTTINEYTLEGLKQAGNAEYVGRLTGVMADGTQHELPVYRIKHLVLGEDCVLKDVEAAIFPRDTRMLLGLTALEKAAPFVFSTNPPRLSLSNCGTAAS